VFILISLLLGGLANPRLLDQGAGSFSHGVWQGVAVADALPQRPLQFLDAALGRDYREAARFGPFVVLLRRER
jgi:hypothetical protein